MQFDSQLLSSTLFFFYSVDEPPAYASIFGELAAKKATSDGVVDFTKEAAGVMDKKASGVAGKICCGIFCGLIGMALPVAEIVIGKWLKETAHISQEHFQPLHILKCCTIIK